MFIENGKTIRLRREFAVPVSKLFTAWKDPTIFRAWWKEITVAEMDFRVGGTIRLQWSEADIVLGVYKQVTENQIIQFTWNGSGACSNEVENLITLKFKSKGAEYSELELVHEFSPTEESRDDHHMGWTCAMLDLDKYFNASVRMIDESLRAEVSRFVPFSVEKVYEAWTKPELLAQWFNSDGATLGKAKVNLKVGRSFFMDFQMRAPKSSEILRMYCEYLEIVPNQKLVFKWADDCMGDEATIHKGAESRVTVTFDKVDGGTKINVVHDLLSSKASMEDYAEGWTDCLKSIEDLLAEASGVLVRINREFKVPLENLFKACSGFAFFSRMGAKTDTSKIDFRAGGKYEVPLTDAGAGAGNRKMSGEFLIIEPNKKIEFTWLTAPCGVELTKDTTVTMKFEDRGQNSFMTLIHKGFVNAEEAGSHLEGWNHVTESIYKNLNASLV